MNSLFNLDREWWSRVCQILDTLSSRKQTLVDRDKDQSKDFLPRNVPFSYQMQWRSAVWLSEAQRPLFSLNVLLTLSRPKLELLPQRPTAVDACTAAPWCLQPRVSGSSGLYWQSWRIGHSSSMAFPSVELELLQRNLITPSFHGKIQLQPLPWWKPIL